jgi:hypothetical protein
VTTTRIIVLVVLSGVAMMIIAWRSFRQPLVRVAVAEIAHHEVVRGGSAGEFKAFASDAGVSCMCEPGAAGCDCR